MFLPSVPSACPDSSSSPTTQCFHSGALLPGGLLEGAPKAEIRFCQHWLNSPVFACSLSTVQPDLCFILSLMDVEAVSCPGVPVRHSIVLNFCSRSCLSDSCQAPLVLADRDGFSFFPFFLFFFFFAIDRPLFFRASSFQSLGKRRPKCSVRASPPLPPPCFPITRVLH